MGVSHSSESGFKKFLKITIIVFVVLIVLNFLVGLFNDDGFIGPQIAIIPLTGEISLYGSTGLLSSGGASAEEIVNQIEKADKDDDVVAIILEINSPGGTVVASEDIAKAIEKANKPVVAWMREVATSGAYWISASSDVIVADPATITGSIGVIGSYLSFDGLFDEYGIKYERLVSGPYKDTGTPYRNLTKSEKNLILGKINKINELFIQHISESRGMDISAVRKVATGEIFLGSEALSLGLVDKIGGKDEAIAIAEELAGVSDSRTVRYESRTGFLERLSALTKIDIQIKNPENSLAIRS